MVKDGTTITTSGGRVWTPDDVTVSKGPLKARTGDSYRGARRNAARRVGKQTGVRWTNVFHQYFRIQFKSARKS
jgi:hypothetical protein